MNDRKFRSELIAQGWTPTDNEKMRKEDIQDAKAVLFFKFLAAINPFYLFPNEHFQLENYISILQEYAKTLVSRETFFFKFYAKFLK